MDISYYVERKGLFGWERLSLPYADLTEAKRIAGVWGMGYDETRIVRVIEEVVV
jgi:hypothetical protein